MTETLGRQTRVRHDLAQTYWLWDLWMNPTRDSAPELPFAWLCRACRLHSDRDFASRDAVVLDAEQHFVECHRSRTAKYTVIHGFARCQWRTRRFLSRICGQSASWAHPPAVQIHLCQTHRRLV
jgi:hypothetical protein